MNLGIWRTNQKPQKKPHLNRQFDPLTVLLITFYAKPLQNLKKKKTTFEKCVIIHQAKNITDK